MSTMNLCIDIGNTRSKYAVFQDMRLLANGVWKKYSVRQIRKIEKEFPSIQRIIISTVTLLDQSFKEEISKKSGKYLVLKHTTPLPIVNKYETPKTLGNDRLSSVIGANALFPKRDCLVIDAGTCIKYDFISAKAIYKGGSISPGMKMRLEAMHHFTAKLPLVKPFEHDDFVGNNTKEAILAGAQYLSLIHI